MILLEIINILYYVGITMKQYPCHFINENYKGKNYIENDSIMIF